MTLKAWPLGTAVLALVAAGCSDPVPAAPRGNLSFTMTGCQTYSGAVGANKDLNQMVSNDGTRPGRRLEDGQEGTSVSCTVDGGDTNTIDARLTGPQSHPSAHFLETVGIVIRDGAITPERDPETGQVTGGMGQAYIELITGGIKYLPVAGTACTLSLNSTRSNSQFTVDAGRIYARFDCPNLTNPPTSGCTASGAFVFERCNED